MADEADRSDDAERELTAPVAPPNLTEPLEPELGADPLFEALWAKVIEAWDDDKTHASVLEYALTAEKLPDLAGRYRHLKDHDPEKRDKAQKRLDAIVLAATQLMMSMRTPPNTKIPLPITLSVAGLFACAVAFAAYALLHRN